MMNEGIGTESNRPATHPSATKGAAMEAHLIAALAEAGIEAHALAPKRTAERAALDFTVAAEEQSAYEDFERRWEAIQEEGAKRDWLRWTGYVGPQLHSPWDKENERRIAAVADAAQQAPTDDAAARQAKRMQDGVARVVNRLYGN